MGLYIKIGTNTNRFQISLPIIKLTLFNYQLEGKKFFPKGKLKNQKSICSCCLIGAIAHAF